VPLYIYPDDTRKRRTTLYYAVKLYRMADATILSFVSLYILTDQEAEDNNTLLYRETDCIELLHIIICPWIDLIN
jgi:hypothetical protein